MYADAFRTSSMSLARGVSHGLTHASPAAESHQEFHHSQHHYPSQMSSYPLYQEDYYSHGPLMHAPYDQSHEYDLEESPESHSPVEMQPDMQTFHAYQAYQHQRHHAQERALQVDAGASVIPYPPSALYGARSDEPQPLNARERMMRAAAAALAVESGSVVYSHPPIVEVAEPAHHHFQIAASVPPCSAGPTSVSPPPSATPPQQQESQPLQQPPPPTSSRVLEHLPPTSSNTSSKAGGDENGPVERKTTGKRAEQNRAAQRAFRERRQHYVKDLEAKAIAADKIDARLVEADAKLASIQCIAEGLATDREAWIGEREMWWREREEAVSVAGALVQELQALNKENEKFREVLEGLAATTPGGTSTESTLPGRKRSRSAEFKDLAFAEQVSKRLREATNQDGLQNRSDSIIGSASSSPRSTRLHHFEEPSLAPKSDEEGVAPDVIIQPFGARECDIPTAPSAEPHH
ncbi:hypothetical protein HKX48_009214 [Thoreauomyces humboldtii]|nr:hypothetical protein HKX48_009214 [Thoreauomyces humboldtii]